MAFQKVATVDEIPEGSGKQVVLDGRKIAVFNVRGKFYAVQDSCSHRNASLSQGTVRGSDVICPWHQSRFSLRDGSNKNPPATQGLATYPIQLEGDEIQVDAT